MRYENITAIESRLLVYYCNCAVYPLFPGTLYLVDQWLGIWH